MIKGNRKNKIKLKNKKLKKYEQLELEKELRLQRKKNFCNLSSDGLYSGLVIAEEKGRDLEDYKRHNCLIQAERHSYA